MIVKETLNGALIWNIRKFVSKGDYYYAVVPEHPNKTKNNYVLAHRVIMENHLGRVLDTNEIVHHIDGNKKNNLIENLQLMTASEHLSHHGQEVGKSMVKLKCPQCGNIFHKSKRQTHLIKGGKATFCSRSLVGQNFGEMYS